MNNKLSSSVIQELSFLTSYELATLLEKLNDRFCNECYGYYETLKYIAKHYTDEQIIPLLNTSPEFVSSDKRTSEEKLQELKSYYVKSDTINVTTNDIPMFKRGRKKQETTLKDKIFAVLDENIENYEELDYKGVLESGITDIAENTFRTILSQWRKEKGIKVKRGRKAKG